jgi:hypothetical protein
VPRSEERADRLRVEGEARRKLKQQRAELAAEARHLLEKYIERRVRPARRRACVMSFGALTAKAKPSGAAADQRW